MAALDGKILIGIDYRPCLVTEPSKKQIKALFHCWVFYSQPYNFSPMLVGYSGGRTSNTIALVEYEDGTIHEVNPIQIRFIDNAMREYAFPEMEEKESKDHETYLSCHNRKTN